jgi:hypothetical protein
MEPPAIPVRFSFPYYWIPVGLLDADVVLDFAAQIFLGSRAAWSGTAQRGVQFDGAPELDDLLRLLHERR